MIDPGVGLIIWIGGAILGGSLIQHMIERVSHKSAQEWGVAATFVLFIAIPVAILHYSSCSFDSPLVRSYYHC
jgi:hypothetical protein